MGEDVEALAEGRDPGIALQAFENLSEILWEAGSPLFIQNMIITSRKHPRPRLRAQR
jgi:hypothetical protein